PITIEKVIDQKWSVSDPIEIEPGNLSAKELYARFAPVENLGEPNRFELQTCRLRKIATKFKDTTSCKFEFGTPPLLESQEVNCCAEMFEEFPILSVAGSLLIARNVFDLFAPRITPEFFITREYNID
ncbi:MAG: hypothetical protein KDB03_26755, partial [Planctomycetales bacterium]|nr:hypothetical protein [Planctomycetales bacterium]